MSFSEFDILSDDELLSAMKRLKWSIEELEELDNERNITSPVEDYMLSEMRDRLDLLTLEANRRGMSLIGTIFLD